MMVQPIIPKRRKSFALVGQIPVKIINAIAMGKPIISTNISDILKVLKGCGWIIEPNDPNNLAEMIKSVLSIIRKRWIGKGV